MALGFLGESAAAKEAQKAAEIQRLQTLMVMQGAQQNAAPYVKLGKTAAAGYGKALPGLTDVKQYKEFTDPYTMEQYKQSPLYTPMVTNLAELQATPGYQFQLEQGLQAQQQGAAARGGLLSGAQQQALQRYGQGLASTSFQNAWERAQNAYKSAFEANQARGKTLMDANRQAAAIYGNATGIGNQAQMGLTNAGVQLLQPLNDAQQQIGLAKGVQAAAPYKGASSAIGLGTSLLGGAIGNAGGLSNLLGMGSQSVYDPLAQDYGLDTSSRAQFLGATPTSASSIYNLF